MQLAYFLYIYFNVLLEVVAVEIQHKVVNEIKSVTHNDQRQLICEFSLLQNVNSKCLTATKKKHTEMHTVGIIHLYMRYNKPSGSS